jgi:hypothetical protein
VLAGHVALALAAAFAGAAFYVNFAEHPARLGLDDKSQPKQWKPSYDAGYTMQGTLAVLSGVFALIAWCLTSDPRWIVGAVLILGNWPYTLWVIMPANQQLKATAEQDQAREPSWRNGESFMQ